VAFGSDDLRPLLGAQRFEVTHMLERKTLVERQKSRYCPA
jgi:hypothetical protein